MAQLRSNALALLLASCLALTACGHSANGLISGQRPAPTGPLTVTTSTGIPGFPGNRRRASSQTQSDVQGCERDESSPGAVQNGTALAVNAAGGHGEYALYSYDASGGTVPSVALLLEANQTSQVYVALANYSTGRWEFFGPVTDQARFAFPNSANYVSPSQAMWLAVIVPGGEHTVIRSVGFGAADPTNQPPVAHLTLNVHSSTYPQDLDANGSSLDPEDRLIEYAWDWDNDGIFDEYDDLTGTGHTYAVPGDHYVTLRVTDDQFVSSSITVHVVYVDQPPVAQLTSLTPVADPGSVVALDASGSTDQDDGIAHFAWDLDGNGVFGEAGAEAAAADATTTSMTLSAQPGIQKVSVLVTDAAGATSQADLTLTARGWFIGLVDAGNGLLLPSLAVINGYPAMAYQDNPVDQIIYAQNTRQDGTGSWTRTTVENSGDLNYRPSLVQVNGKPAFGEVDLSTNNLCYAYSSQPDGSSGWTHVDVDTGGNVGGDAALAVTGTGPALSFYDKTNQHLRFAFSSQADGSSGWTSLVVDNSADDTGIYSSLAMINGKPAIAYTDSTSLGANYAYASQPDGSSGWTCEPVIAGGSSPDLGKLIDLNGYPAFVSVDDPTITFAYSSQADGSSGWSTLNPDPADSVAPIAGLVAWNGHPFLAFDLEGGLNGPVVFDLSSQADGSGGWATQTIAPESFSVSAAVAAGRPAVAYSILSPTGGVYFATLFQ